MRPIIPILLTSSVFLIYSVESSSHGAGSSSGPRDITRPVRRLPIPRGQELVVNRQENLVLGTADFENEIFTPFKDPAGREFIEYEIVRQQEPPYGTIYVPQFPHPEKWVSDVGVFGALHDNDWIHGQAVTMWYAHIDEETARREQEVHQQHNAFRQSMQDYSTKRRNRRLGDGGE